nr:hypothetical protein [Synergistaceae bacterium]
MAREFEGKKLLILGGNPETTPLVETANNMGVITIVTSGRASDPAKKAAHKAYDVDGLDVEGLVKLARDEKVDGVLVGVADILVPAYCKVCEILNLPCYATQQIVDVFSFKDKFKETCEKYGVHGIPEFNPEDLENIKFPVMIKPVDNGGGVGMTVAHNLDEYKRGVEIALTNSHKKKFLVEKYMLCDDMGMYYTFKDGYCSASCIYDRYTTDEQPGLSRVCLGGTYPSKHIDKYFANMHNNILKLFKEIGIKNGVLMLSGFYENGEFYVYDTGFRLQGEAPHLILKHYFNYDQREMLIRFALTGSEGEFSLKEVDDPTFGGKWAATLWFLVKEGRIGEVCGLDLLDSDKRVITIVQRLHEGDLVPNDWIGTEKQVFARLYLCADSKDQLAESLLHYMDTVRVFDEHGKDMLLKGFDVNNALELL